jgi:hypothetical protein
LIQARRSRKQKSHFRRGGGLTVNAEHLIVLMVGEKLQLG